ncbi:MAG: hypothetical protein US68_C0012G0039 [Candidatus Shapirobacteria bacterium GW2011_GWE1_38_10]|uniref:Uncharacterized protein n=1 Tax=Candidatus Shapirobacteria bacterium GW2011_GWE1_38_10 TaxID=1618488 RepID=A0A0G0KKF3_9BACT|nr:MAG: hypothetical protein US68_C0012G0039 [Candidatus Shapirobacteria bacterium GW2011_GWE1_38_10]KKQ64622.1 MAG: hypothetical protein US85_C0006G0029 [Candidatus Shapirobacteria bacterium GW2011_GWF1_38_23]HBP51365.1 hypothetical protein [Candidatus Shapirobacteria bacterium]
MSNTIKKISLFLISVFSIILSLYLCEIYLKYIDIQTNNVYSDFMVFEANNIYKIDSHLIYTVSNDKNYRNPTKPKDPTKTNIAFVGDSVTWSFGSKDDNTSYPKSFENISNKSVGNKIIVNNFGIPGYNFDQEYLLIKEKILPEYQPDFVIWNLNVNDVIGSNYSCLFTLKDNQWIRISARRNLYYWYGALKTFRSPLFTTSKLVSYFWYQINSFISPLIVKHNQTFGCSSLDFNQPVQEQIISKLDYFIKDLNTEFKKNDIKLIITLVPYQQSLDNQGTVDQIAPEYFILKKYLNFNNSINFIDYNELLPKTKLNPANEYFLDSSEDIGERGWRHPNQKTYDLMAIILKNYVQKNKLF